MDHKVTSRLQDSEFIYTITTVVTQRGYAPKDSPQSLYILSRYRLRERTSAITHLLSSTSSPSAPFPSSTASSQGFHQYSTTTNPPSTKIDLL
jgi:hypothetical protein